MNKQLVKAVQKGDVTKVRSILQTELGPQINDGKVTAKMFLNSPVNNNGDTYAHLACRHGHIDVLKTLVGEYNVNTHIKNLEGKILIHECAQAGHERCLQFLLENLDDDKLLYIDSMKRADWTSLMLACTKSNINIIKKLIESGSQTTLRNKDGWNCFHIAAREGHCEVLNYLLDVSPSVWMTLSNNGRTPLHTAALHGKTEAVKILITRCRYQSDAVDSCGTTPFMDAIRANHSATAQYILLSHSVDVCKVDLLGRQAVHYASQAGSVDTLTFLTDQLHVNPCACDNGGNTPAHLAAREGHVCVLELLASHDNSLTALDAQGRSVLYMAILGQHTECVNYILTSHDSLNQHDESSRARLNSLAMKPEIISLLRQ